MTSVRLYGSRSSIPSQCNTVLASMKTDGSRGVRRLLSDFRVASVELAAGGWSGKIKKLKVGNS